MPDNIRASGMFNFMQKSYDFSGRSVLDLGCGYGNLLMSCVAHGAAKVTGVDNNPDMLTITRDRLDRGAPSGVEVYTYALDLNSRSDLSWLRH